jgi:predicted nucleic acid-binding protein
LIALPDVNVLLALGWSNHPHHNAAHDWFAREASAGWATCLLTQSAFVRLSIASVRGTKTCWFFRGPITLS